MSSIHSYGREILTIDNFVSTVQGGSPANQAVTLSYAQQHVRALGQIDAAQISVFIDAATSYFFEQTSRSPLTQTREFWLDRFPFIGAMGRGARIELPHPPLQSVLSVQYIDSTGVLRNFNDGGSPATNLFTTVIPAGDYAVPGFVEPLYGKTWPIARDQTGSVKIRYKCGYGDTAAAVPALVRGILCLLIAHFDTFRSAVHEARRGQVIELPYGVEVTMDAFKKTAASAQVLRDYGYASPYAIAVGGSIVL
jgi:hypothetical protein